MRAESWAWSSGHWFQLHSPPCSWAFLPLEPRESLIAGFQPHPLSICAVSSPPGEHVPGATPRYPTLKLGWVPCILRSVVSPAHKGKDKSPSLAGYANKKYHKHNEINTADLATQRKHRSVCCSFHLLKGMEVRAVWPGRQTTRLCVRSVLAQRAPWGGRDACLALQRAPTAVCEGRAAAPLWALPGVWTTRGTAVHMCGDLKPLPQKGLGLSQEVP